jgi:hypothetical protein
MAWSVVIERIRAGAYHGMQVDYAAWAAKVSLREIHELVNELYPSTPSDESSLVLDELDHLERELASFRLFIETLPEGEYALVAVESG